MQVATKACRVCGAGSIVDGVDALGFVRWSQLGVNIQDALPDLTADERELLLTGTHPHCWVRLLGPGDE